MRVCTPPTIHRQGSGHGHAAIDDGYVFEGEGGPAEGKQLSKEIVHNSQIWRSPVVFRLGES